MKFSLTGAFSVALALLAVDGIVAQDAATFPDIFSLPDGFRPEGVVAGPGTDIYVSCTRGLQVGAIWKGDIKTGVGSVFIAPTGDPTRGLSLDNQGRLWVAWIYGARVYDSATGALLKEYRFVPDTNAVINDVIVAGDKVIFTDSGSSVPNGRGETGVPRLFLLDLSATELPEDFTELVVTSSVLNLDLGGPTLNGIETVPADSSKAVACHTNLGILVNIDLTTGEATEVPLENAGPRPANTCDGLVRRGKTLYIVRNRDSIVSEVSLNPDGTEGVLEQDYPLTSIIADPNLDTPTTGALYGDYLYMPDSRFRLNCAAVDCNVAPFSVYRIKLN